MIACKLGALEIVSYLIDRGANTIPCAYVAAKYGHLDILKMLLNKGINLNGFMVAPNIVSSPWQQP